MNPYASYRMRMNASVRFSLHLRGNVENKAMDPRHVDDYGWGTRRWRAIP